MKSGEPHGRRGGFPIGLRLNLVVRPGLPVVLADDEAQLPFVVLNQNVALTRPEGTVAQFAMGFDHPRLRPGDPVIRGRTNDVSDMPSGKEVQRPLAVEPDPGIALVNLLAIQRRKFEGTARASRGV